MGFFSRLFGGSSKTVEVKTVEPVEYKGFQIYPESIAEGGQFRIAGRIEKSQEGEVKRRVYETSASECLSDSILV